MKKHFYLLSLLASSLCFCQTTNLGGNATLWVGDQASFYFGGNTTLNGTVTNNGKIISYSDLDFVLNTDVGSLRFTGTTDQNLAGDTLNVVDLEVEKSGNSNVVLLTDRVVVSGMLNVISGVIKADDELDLLVSGSSDGTGQGFVEGKLVGLSTGQPVTFPMGINGSPNYITLSGTNSGTVFRVECVQPDPTTIRGDVDIQSISTDVEWVVTSIGAGSDGQISINFSGVDLSTPNIEVIRAEVYQTAIVALADGDSLFRVLSSVRSDLDDPTISPTTGTILVDDLIGFSEDPVRLAVAWIPVVNDIEFFVPNSFAPNGNEIENRTFRPFFSGDEITRISFTVFNSLNAEVFSVSQSGSNLDLEFLGWDGVLPSGQQAPGGVYYYNVVLTSLTDQRSKAGAVLLVK
ncbi:MAG: hypothetical protein ABJP45_00650 [Cyclobacteriaceae bacterium]